MQYLIRTVCYLFLLMLYKPVFSDIGTALINNSGQRFALVIGNSHYQTSPLNNPVNDAQDIAQLLEKIGFQVSLKKDQSQSEMRAAIRDFGYKIRNGGVGLFYYAGHGMQINGENFLIPIGNDIQEEDEISDQAIKLNLVLNKMATADNKMNIVILDACRDNPFVRSFRSASKGLALVDGPTGTFIAYSTQPGATASDGDSSNGLYTKHLLNNMLKPGLTIEQVFKRVRNQVMKDSGQKQIPWELSSLIGEDFYFLNKADADSVPVQQVAMLESDVQLSLATTMEDTQRNIGHPKILFGPLTIKEQNDSSNTSILYPFTSLTETISISFDVNDLPPGTLIKGVWSDAGRNTNLQEMFLVSVKENDRMSFKLIKPLGGFTQGTYMFNIYHDGDIVSSAEFEIMK